MQENKKSLSTIRKLNIVFVAIAVVLFAGTLLFSDAFSLEYLPEMTDFDSGWCDEEGNLYKLSEIKNSDYKNGVITLSKKLPIYLFDGECICFESKNVNIKVSLDKRRVYEFLAEENITGIGYGVAFHKVGISREDAGKTFIIECQQLTEKNSSAHIYRVYLGQPAEYIRWFIHDRALLLIASVLIVFFGLLLFVLWLGIPDKSRQPFDVFSLAVATFIIGLWCLINTNAIQLLSGHYYFWRTLGTLIVPMIGYPFVVFYTSLTKFKKNIYSILAFAVSVGTEASMIVLRFVADMDMMNTVGFFALVVLGSDIVLMMIAYIENRIHCRALGIKTDFFALNIGLSIFAVLTLIDILLWEFAKNYRDTYGIFMRFGMVVLTIIMILKFVSWWTMDQVAMDRDRFINRSLQFAAASKNPVESIKLLLEYLGKELDAKRTYIFELDDKNRIRETYEWYKDGVTPLAQEIKAAASEKEFAKMRELGISEDVICVVVNNPDEIKETSQFTYQVMKRNNIGNAVFSPLRTGDEIVGFVGLTDISAERIPSVNEIMKVLPHFFTQFINQRKEQDRIIYYSYHDYLSKAKNRTALKKFTKEKFDKSQAFGYVLCEIEGLKDINAKLGHDIGDEIVKITAKNLMDVFGDENVYRLSGEIFAAFGFENDETYFENDVQMARRLLLDEGSPGTIVGVYCSNGTMNFDVVISHAYELLEKEKQDKAKGE